MQKVRHSEYLSRESRDFYRLSRNTFQILSLTIIRVESTSRPLHVDRFFFWNCEGNSSIQMIKSEMQMVEIWCNLEYNGYNDH